eukprot:TRINITY_DN3566_c0_g1_i1.p1 TRINITY_DN3566_c0_g1~~TRINITY_DN3566_c0_g1_i1.p1  ORF type:complete len:340 (-),score=44.93 TRINITY_DN3566_c0_g1_i1:63-1082(-)
MGNQLSEKFDLNHPLWRVNLIENYKQGSAVIIVLHHVIGDGIALMHILDTILDTDHHNNNHHSKPSATPVVITKPTLISNLTKIVTIGIKSVIVLGKLIMVAGNPSTVPLFKKYGLQGGRVVSWVDVATLDEVRAIGRKLKVTVNDVIIAALAGAFHRIAPHGSERVWMLSPVNLRLHRERHLNVKASKEPSLTNDVGTIFLPLSLKLNPIDRLSDVKSETTYIKASPEPFITAFVTFVMANIGLFAMRLVCPIFANRVTALLTNVPGPTHQKHIAGQPIDRLIYFIPTQFSIPMFFGVISYNNNISVSVSADRALTECITPLLTAFKEELELMNQQII